jgi:hypothetical protein
VNRWSPAATNKEAGFCPRSRGLWEATMNWFCILPRALDVVGAATLGVTLALAGPAAAEDIVAPSDPIAKAAFDALSKNCSRCHQEGKLTARERPAKNFGFILRLDQLAADPHYVLPGNPYGSKIYKQIVDKEMPYDVVYEGASPDISADDIKAIETWIQSLGTKTAAACETHKFVKDDDLEGAQEEHALSDADTPQERMHRRRGDESLSPRREQARQQPEPLVRRRAARDHRSGRNRLPPQPR